MFALPEGSNFNANHISICIQPDEGIHLRFEAKVPDSEQAMRSVNMEFHYRDSFGDQFPDAYERLLMEALNGDASLFTRSDGIEASWRVIDPVLAGWESQPELAPLATYDRGSVGPAEAEDLVHRDGRHWCTGSEEH
jgi:glucose-6-phosphate 1-dehydrogenase